MEPSPYSPLPARPQVQVSTPVDPGLLPISRSCQPQLRRPALLVARADAAYWDTDVRDFLPALDQRPLRPGANGVGVRRDANGVLVEDVTHYVADLQRMRWRVLVNGDPTLAAAIPGGIFLRSYACERGLTATVPFWETPDLVSRDRELKWRCDDDARRTFIQRLIAHRLIDPITEEAARAVYSQAAGTLGLLVREERHRAAHGTQSPDLIADIKRLEVRCAHMEARLAGDDPFELEAEPVAEIRRGKARRVTESVETVPEPTPAPAPAPGTITLADAREMAAAAVREAVAAALAQVAEKPARKRKGAPDAE